MVIRKLLLLLAIGLPAVMFGTTVELDQTTCPTASLASYQSLGSGGCMVNGLLFNNFVFLNGFSNGATPTPTAADILISPDTTVGGLAFAYPFVTRNYVSFALQYDFDPPPAAGGTLDLDVMGDVDIFESICPGGQFQNLANGCFGRPGDTPPVNLEVYNEHLGATKLTDSAVINPPVTIGEVQIYFALNGLPNAPAGFDRLGNALTPNVPTSPVPEPRTIALLLGGLCLILCLKLLSLRKRIRES